MKNQGLWVGVAAALAVWFLCPAMAVAQTNEYKWLKCLRSLSASGPTPAFSEEQVADAFARVEAFWRAEFAKRGWPYKDFHYKTNYVGKKGPCGRARLGMGPFYCPPNHTVYLDSRWFTVASDSIGEATPEFLMLVVAHEVGHHIQQIRGATQKGKALAFLEHGEGELADAYYAQRLEHQADCLAGTFLASLHDSEHFSDEQVRRAVHGAIPLGDDFQVSLGLRRGFFVSPKTPHGTSRLRLTWIVNGFRTGALESCEPFGEPLF